MPAWHCNQYGLEMSRSNSLYSAFVLFLTFHQLKSIYKKDLIQEQIFCSGLFYMLTGVIKMIAYLHHWLFSRDFQACSSVNFCQLISVRHPQTSQKWLELEKIHMLSTLQHNYPLNKMAAIRPCIKTSHPGISQSPDSYAA